MKNLIYIFLLFTIYSCANIGRPTGGPVDDIPPVFVKASPAPGTMNVQPKKIYIDFDENIKLDKASEKVVVSPPQLIMPVVSSNGHRVTIELKDSLLANTTYSIEFSDAIQDLNEGNPLKDFSYSFSTGDAIDTLKVMGKLLNAENLEPVTGTYVGIQSDLRDSAFVQRPFIRIGKTNALGEFTISNIAPGSYRIYALKDINNNYLFDLPNEDIAFLDSIIVPSYEMKIHSDTIWKDSLTVDTVIVHEVGHYYPDDLVLLSFNENKKMVYLEKNERLQKNKLTFYFSAPEDSLVKLKGLNFNEKDFALIESSVNKDTVTFWIKDTIISNIDTLKFTATYLYTDTLSRLVERTDTIRSFMRVKNNVAKVEKKSRKKDSDETPKDSVVYLIFKDNVSGSMDIGKRPVLIFEEPVDYYELSKIKLFNKKDSILTPVDLTLVERENNIREYVVNARLRPGEQYELQLDSAAFTSIYDRSTNKYSKTFSVKNIDEYSNLIVQVSNVKGPAFVEVLDAQDKPVGRGNVVNGVAKIMRLAPGTYYLRLINDTNNNGKWDTGNYAEKRQPEQVRYFNQSVTLRANWDVQQEWDIDAVPLINQKPLEITKNKPKEIQRGSDVQDPIDQNNNNSNSYNAGGGRVSGSAVTR